MGKVGRGRPVNLYTVIDNGFHTEIVMTRDAIARLFDMDVRNINKYMSPSTLHLRGRFQFECVGTMQDCGDDQKGNERELKNVAKGFFGQLSEYMIYYKEVDCGLASATEKSVIVKAPTMERAVRTFFRNFGNGAIIYGINELHAQNAVAAAN